MKRQQRRFTPRAIVVLTILVTLCMGESLSYAGQRVSRTGAKHAPSTRFRVVRAQPTATETDSAPATDDAKAPMEQESMAPPVATEEETIDSPDDDVQLFESPGFAEDESYCDPTCEGLLPLCGSCGVWADLDYLVWWRRARQLPPLVTTDPNDGILPDGTILFGNDRVGSDARPGGRIRLGTWLGRSGAFSLEASFLAMADAHVNFETDSSISPTLARPFFNLTEDLNGDPIGNDVLQVALDGTSTGDISVTSSSDIWLADVVWRGLLCEINRTRLDLLTGYAASRIDEDLLIRSSTVTTADGNQFDILDSFVTENQFHGGVIGFELTHTVDRVNLSFLARLGLGNMRQTVIIDGRQTITVPGDDPNTAAGGLLAQTTNIGRFMRDDFAVNPELGFRLNYQLTNSLNVTAGYSFLHWNKVARPGDQIDLSINPNQPPPDDEPQRPAFAFRDGEYYLHGLNVGFQLVY